MARTVIGPRQGAAGGTGGFFCVWRLPSARRRRSSPGASAGGVRHPARSRAGTATLDSTAPRHQARRLGQRLSPSRSTAIVRRARDHETRPRPPVDWVSGAEPRTPHDLHRRRLEGPPGRQPVGRGRTARAGCPTRTTWSTASRPGYSNTRAQRPTEPVLRARTASTTAATRSRGSGSSRQGAATDDNDNNPAIPQFTARLASAVFGLGSVTRETGAAAHHLTTPATC